MGTVNVEELENISEELFKEKLEESKSNVNPPFTKEELIKVLNALKQANVKTQTTKYLNCSKMG